MIFAAEAGEITGREDGTMASLDMSFTGSDLEALRHDMIRNSADYRDAAEMLQAFLWGHGYGVSREAALESAHRVEGAHCDLGVITKELEQLAQVA